jgi:voltage-gated potassium channel
MKRPKSPRLTGALMILTGLTVFFGLIIVPLEKTFSTQTRFSTYEDGLWWAATTVTAVGYGDYVPVTSLGRIIGVILETVGVTMFGIIIAFVTINLLRKEQQYYWGRQTERFDRLERSLDEIKKQQSFNLGETKPKSD